ncbi:hypothetical protein GCM10010439_12870 [Actinocorallia aurantiaca]|uniref:Uncharacterized protein n=1 Tax=Actinocorallia aurantiaca TaxID=46204 RepID=A0ABN3TZD8_9ACTN
MLISGQTTEITADQARIHRIPAERAPRPLPPGGRDREPGDGGRSPRRARCGPGPRWGGEWCTRSCAVRPGSSAAGGRGPAGRPYEDPGRATTGLGAGGRWAGGRRLKAGGGAEGKTGRSGPEGFPLGTFPGIVGSLTVAPLSATCDRPSLIR